MVYSDIVKKLKFFIAPYFAFWGFNKVNNLPCIILLKHMKHSYRLNYNCISKCFLYRRMSSIIVIAWLAYIETITFISKYCALIHRDIFPLLWSFVSTKAIFRTLNLHDAAPIFIDDLVKATNFLVDVDRLIHCDIISLFRSVRIYFMRALE